MPKTVIATNKVYEAFLNDAAKYGDQNLTEAIGTVLWCYVLEAAGDDRDLPPATIDAGRALSREHIYSYVKSQPTTVDITGVEHCATDVGTLCKASTPAKGDITPTVFCDAWIKVSNNMGMLLQRLARDGKPGVRGFAC